MCLINIAYKMCSGQDLIIAANRDEYFHRPSKEAHFWDSHPKIYGGLDLEANGTWMAVDSNGRFGVVANWTETETNPCQTLSRGDLVKNYLLGVQSIGEYLDSIEWHRYRGVNLLLYDGMELHYANNRTGDRLILEPGYYGMTNTHLFDNWQRALDGVELLKANVPTNDMGVLIDMLFVNEITESSEVLGFNFSPCFIVGETYGTRASSVVVFESDAIRFCEQNYGPAGRIVGRKEQLIQRENRGI